MILQFTLHFVDHIPEPGDFYVDADMILAVVECGRDSLEDVPTANLMLRTGYNILVRDTQRDAAKRWAAATGERIDEEDQDASLQSG